MISASLKERVYDAVIQAIITGELTADKIISEKQLCEQLQVSKSPVREALVELCSQRVLESIPRRGYKVVRFNDRNLKDILQFRVMLECGCLESCFESITPTQIHSLEDIVEREFSFLSQQSTIDYWNNTLSFHLTLASFANNEYIYSQLRMALYAYMRGFLQLHWGELRDNSLLKPSVLHWEIVKSLRDGNKADTIELLKRDINTLYHS